MKTKKRVRHPATSARFKYPRFKDWWKLVRHPSGDIGIITVEEMTAWSERVFKVARELKPLR